MPQSFFIGKKREMFEHPVFCLASQVMDLTIREYLHHPLLSFYPSPPSFKHSFTSLPSCLLSLLRDVAAAMLVFSCLCLLSVRVSGERTSRERSEQYHTESVGVPFSTICLWWTWMSSLVCKASFFWLDAHSFDLNAFLHCLHCYLLQSFGQIMCQWCAVLNR